jgi:hypothetical protein
MPQTRNLFSILLFFLYSTFVQGQKVKIELKNNDSIIVNSLALYNFDYEYRNYEEAINAVQKLKTSFEKSGFLNNELLLTRRSDSIYFLKIDKNSKIDSITLSIPEKISHLINSKNNTKIKLNYNQLPSFLDNLKNLFEEEGNSFSEISLINIRTKNNKIHATLKILNKEKRFIEKTIIKDYKDFPINYRERYLNTNQKITFNKKNITAISNKIKKLDFVNQFKEPEFLFTNDSTFLYLYIKRKKINQFDGLIGFSSNENGKLIFNGHLDIALKNNFNKGETISLFWSNNGNEQQDLRLNISTPYIYNSIFSPEINLTIRKQDSTFINTSLSAKLNVTLIDNHTLGALLKNESSKNSLVITNSNIQNFDKTSYGIEYTYKKQSSSILKTHIQTSFELGTRKTTDEKFNQTILSFHIEHNISVFSRGIINLRNTSKILNSKNILFNELYQIGGATTIRGFNEKSIFASSFNYSNIEYRFQTGGQSYLYTFSDIGFTNNKIDNSKNTLTSFGLGYSYKTKTGKVDINYGLGKTDKTKLELDKGLFHIKFVNLF